MAQLVNKHVSLVNTMTEVHMDSDVVREKFGVPQARIIDYLASDPSCWKNSDRRKDIISLPVEVDGLVPHKQPMLVVDRLLEVKERESVSEIKISEDSIFVGEDGRLNEVSYPEIFSQAIAAQNGFKKMGNGESRSEGLLLAIKNMEVMDSAYAGDNLTVSVFKAARYGGFGII